MAKANTNVQAKEKGSGKGRVSGKGKIFLLLVLVVAVVAYLFFTYGSLPSAVIAARQLNSSALVSIMAQKVNSTAVVNLSYSGSIVINNTDPLLSFFYSKNGSQSWSSVALREMPNVGNIEASAYLNQSSGKGIGCVVYNFTGRNNNSKCENSAYPYSVYTTVLGYLFDLNSVGNVSTTSYGLTVVSGQPCYSVSGSGTVMVNEGLFNKTGFAPAGFTFNTCLSAKYNVPLSVEVHAVLKNGDAISFDVQNYGMKWSTG